jgi:predicted DNA-binding transcriptional regulator AlpA
MIYLSLASLSFAQMRRTSSKTLKPSETPKTDSAKDQLASPNNPSELEPWLKPREPLVKAEDVAAYLQVKVETVFRWARKTEDPLPMRQFGLRGFRRFKMSEVESWLDRRNIAPTPPEPTLPDERPSVIRGKKAQPGRGALSRRS